MSAAAAPPGNGVPLLVVTDVAGRLVRRGLLAAPDAAAGGWVGARVLVFRHGPIVCEPPPGAVQLGVRCELRPARAR